MKKILSIITALTIFYGHSPRVFAAPVPIEVDCLCMNYEVYGSEQPERSGDTCRVMVDIDPALTPEEIAEEKAKADAAALEQPPERLPTIGEIGFDPARIASTGAKNFLQNGLPSLGGAGQYLASPFLTLMGGLKDGLSRLSKVVFKDHTEKYHAFMDEKIFAPAIAKISGFQDSTTLGEFLKTQDGACSAENPLPGCVAERALCSYEKYSRVIFEQTGQSLAGKVSNSDDVQTILSVLQQRDQDLFQEVVQSEQALDTALAVYSEFFETYRLHLRFKEVIAALVKVRNMTSFLHQLVGCIPNKFVGVATTKCN